jgi:FlaG/FlaF family flagellin (archaellin)
MRKKIRSIQAVSEVVGVVLLLGITLSLFAVLNTFVFSFSFDTSAPSVNLIGTIDKSNDVVYIKHNGGDSLPGDIKVLIQIGSQTYQKTSGELLIDTNTDTKWNFGENLRFDSPQPLFNKYIRATVVNPETNSIILSVVLQQGMN